MSRRRLGGLRADVGGIAAIEFALVFPLLLLLLLGSFELATAMVAQTKTRKIAYSIDQLITKAQGLDAALVQETLRASGSLIAPFDPSRLSIDVTYRYTDEDGDVQDRWTQRRGGADEEAEPELPAEYANLREVGYLLTRVRYAHQATFPALFFESIELSAESIVRPRPGAPLTCEDC